MTVEECTAILGPLALAMRAAIDAPTFRAYARVLRDVPPALLERALDDLSREGLRFFPAATELLTACEKARRVLLALNPYDGCAECEDQRGFRTVLGREGQKTVEPCPCKARHQQKLARLGVLDAVALLPGEATHESEQVFPTVDQIPAPLRQQIAQAVGRKVLR